MSKRSAWLRKWAPTIPAAQWVHWLPPICNMEPWGKRWCFRGRELGQQDTGSVWPSTPGHDAGPFACPASAASLRKRISPAVPTEMPAYLSHDMHVSSQRLQCSLYSNGGRFSWKQLDTKAASLQEIARLSRTSSHLSTWMVPATQLWIRHLIFTPIIFSQVKQHE